MSPADGTQVTEFAQVNGAVSIAPFENNLSYFIYDEAGNQLGIGPVTVTAPDFGAPGTFSELIPVSYTHLRAHETVLDLVCRLLLEKKNTKTH